MIEYQWRESLPGGTPQGATLGDSSEEQCSTCCFWHDTGRAEELGFGVCATSREEPGFFIVGVLRNTEPTYRCDKYEPIE